MKSTFLPNSAILECTINLGGSVASRQITAGLLDKSGDSKVDGHDVPRFTSRPLDSISKSVSRRFVRVGI